jgi:hypothetical protein
MQSRRLALCADESQTAGLLSFGRFEAMRCEERMNEILFKWADQN